MPLTLTLALAPTLTRTLALTLTNRQLDSALDVAGRADKRINRAARLSVRKLLLEAAPHARVLVLHHPECSGHATGDNHQVRVTP